MAFSCPRCGITSHHPEDERQGYCGICHDFTGEPGRVAAADQLRAKLRRQDHAYRMYLTEAQYRVQVDYTCQLLDAVDEVTDAVTATLITDVICERLTGDGVSAAAERIRNYSEELVRLAREKPIRFRP